MPFQRFSALLRSGRGRSTIDEKAALRFPETQRRVGDTVADPPFFIRPRRTGRARSGAPADQAPLRQYPGGAGGRTSLIPAKATESAASGVAPAGKPFSLRMYAIAAA